MRFRLGLALVVCAGLVCAQSNEVAGEDPGVVRARAGIEKLRALVAAGAAPRAELDRAEAAIADAEDGALLRRTVYGTELSDGQSEAMIAAARRRLERREQELTHARQLVEEGVTSQASLGTFLDEVDRSQKELDLAESRARLTHELTLMAEAEQNLQQRLEQAPAEASALAERFDGNGVFSAAMFRTVERAFARQFNRTLPVSALGETTVHRSLGFDHRGRVDIALHPDQPEGVWLRHYLTDQEIPFFAFRQAVPGKATGAHIHIGPISTRLAKGG